MSAWSDFKDKNPDVPEEEARKRFFRETVVPNYSDKETLRKKWDEFNEFADKETWTPPKDIADVFIRQTEEGKKLYRPSEEFKRQVESDPGLKAERDRRVSYEDTLLEQGGIDAVAEYKKSQRGGLAALKAARDDAIINKMVYGSGGNWQPQSGVEDFIYGATKGVLDSPWYALSGLLSKGNPAATMGFPAALETYAQHKATTGIDTLPKVGEAIKDMAISGTEGALTGYLLKGTGKIGEAVVQKTGSKVIGQLVGKPIEALTVQLPHMAMTGELPSPAEIAKSAAVLSVLHLANKAYTAPSDIRRQYLNKKTISMIAEETGMKPVDIARKLKTPEGTKEIEQAVRGKWEEIGEDIELVEQFRGEMESLNDPSKINPELLNELYRKEAEKWAQEHPRWVEVEMDKIRKAENETGKIEVPRKNAPEPFAPIEGDIIYPAEIQKKADPNIPYINAKGIHKSAASKIELTANAIVDGLTPEQIRDVERDPSSLKTYIDKKASGYDMLGNRNYQDAAIRLAREKLQRAIEEPAPEPYIHKDIPNEPDPNYKPPGLSKIDAEERLYQKALDKIETQNRKFWEKHNSDIEKKSQKEMSRINYELDAYHKSIGGKESVAPEHRERIENIIKMDESEMRAITESVPTVKPGALKRILKNPQREIELKFGRQFKEATYDVLRQAEHNFIVEDSNVAQKIKPERKKYSFRERERIGAYLVSLQENGLDTLASMKVEIPKLTEKEKAGAEYIRTELDKILPRINAARSIAGMKPIEGIKDYFTFLRKFSLLEELGYNPITASEEAWSNAGNEYHSKGFAFQFGKERVESSRALELDAFYVYEKYARAALRTIHMTPVIGKMRQMMEGSGWKEYNPIAHDYVQSNLDYISGMNISKAPEVVNKIANKLNRNVGVFILSYNLNSAAIQPTAIVGTISKLGPKYVGRGVADLFSKKMRKFAVEKSRVLKGRNHDINIEEMTKGLHGRLGKLKEGAIDIGTLPLRYIDFYTAEATWLSAYRYATKKLGMGERDAIRYSDDAVVNTQGSASRLDLAPIQRTPLGKSATLFQTFVINNWNFMVNEMAGVGNESVTRSEAFRRTARYIAAATVSNTIIELAGQGLGIPSINTGVPAPLSAFYKKMKEEEEKNKTREGDKKTNPMLMGAWEAGKEMAGYLPGIGGAFRYGGKSGFGAIGSLVMDTMDAVSGQPGAKGLGWIALKWYGLPGGQQIYKTVKRLERDRKEEEKKKKTQDVSKALKNLNKEVNRSSGISDINKEIRRIEAL